MPEFRELMEWVGTGVDGLGVLAVVAGTVVAVVRFVVRRRTAPPGTGYRTFRQDVGRAILLGLEFLVAGDIIRTVVVAPTLQNVAVLGLIVLIRTFLSVSLQLELDGRWPWQKPTDPAAETPAAVTGST